MVEEAREGAETSQFQPRTGKTPSEVKRLSRELVLRCALHGAASAQAEKLLMKDWPHFAPGSPTFEIGQPDQA